MEELRMRLDPAPRISGDTEQNEGGELRSPGTPRLLVAEFLQPRQRYVAVIGHRTRHLIAGMQRGVLAFLQQE